MMTSRINSRGLRTIQSFRHWQTNNDLETLIELEPIFLSVNNCLHINSTHKGADGRRRSAFIHVLSLGDVVILRDFLNEMLATAERELQLKSKSSK